MSAQPNWRTVYASVEGTSHQAAGTLVQDSCCVEVIERPEGPVLVAACSDGAGSAPRSREGSIAVSSEVVRFFSEAEALAADEAGLAEQCRQAAASARRRLEEKAAEGAHELRDLACTLLLAVVTPTGAAFAQVGDGAIVVRTESALGLVFFPQNEEYANVTNFLTSDDWTEKLEVRGTAASVQHLAMLTDGMQSICLQLAHQVPHAPFFERMFASLAKAPAEADLTEHLQGFLESGAVNARTDDDKTLVLAVRGDDRDREAV